MIILTGGSGHIGNNLARIYANNNVKIKVLLRSESKALSDVDVIKVIGDLTDPNFYKEQIKKGDIIIHLAGFIDLYNRSYQESYQANFLMTKMIADHCLEVGAKLVYSSSADILKKDANDYEDIIINPDDFKYNYHKTKAMAHQYCKSLVPKGLDLLIFYPTAVIGINDFKGSMAGQAILMANKYKVLPYLKGGYNFVDVKDVCKAITKAVELDLKGDLILGNQYKTLKEIYQIISDVTNQKKHLVFIPKWLAIFGVIFIKKFNRLMIEIVTRKTNFDNQKMQELLKGDLIPLETTFLEIINANSK